ncbi:Unannotated [Lentimonas sp. CC4]|uniref:REP-associated tyrosine transposase n=2 Tax=Lentimonas TaxID=417293 RepID=UPI00132BFC75|nr:transposase [Lentimonas sp. CC21]CAA6680014.1 Unannotated [Lentimonas sp. CC4]CAA6687221.1 Unannotated [Lentimonas sp. CC6]CAA7183491.1 Unannotated [Lentimonas sp. CC8]CAA7074379.1 Unannotated [Lentimonas sp. CC4]CAA7172166.1 Unannotated [Lentimonas sp. CC21]
MSENQCPNRKRPVHLPSMAKGNRSSIQFVTVCVKERRPILANERVHTLLRELWSDSSVFMVGRYVIMPDHIHLFCAPNALPSPSLKPWVGYWKSCFASSAKLGQDGKLWQRDFWDRELRTGESYSEKWAYVFNNPVRAGLVQKAEDWPYAGEMFPLSWHD